jgi:NADPH-dependent curcumin reductase CurA
LLAAAIAASGLYGLHLDGCLDYRAADLDQQLQSAFLAGVDVFSDGVGGGLTEDLSGS